MQGVEEAAHGAYWRWYFDGGSGIQGNLDNHIPNIIYYAINNLN